MLGHATIEEKYKENMKNTLFILSKCNENLAFKNQLLFSGPDGAKKFQDPLNLDLDDLKKKKKGREPFLTCCPEEIGWRPLQPGAWCFCRGQGLISQILTFWGVGARPQESAQTCLMPETVPVAF